MEIDQIDDDLCDDGTQTSHQPHDTELDIDDIDYEALDINDFDDDLPAYVREAFRRHYIAHSRWALV